MKLKISAAFILIMCFAPCMPQSGQGINQTDKNGRKQGHWIKKYPNGNIMYDGYFTDNMPSGEFRRFYEDNTIKSLLVFSNNGTEAKATLYYPNSFVASKGKYINQHKEGKWQFYSSTTEGVLISVVEYSGDKKNGLSIKYYPDNSVAEKLYYKNDIKHGEWLKYYPDGTLTLRTNTVDGKLNGKFEAFFENGKPEMTGQYKNDLKEGLWIIYRKDGSQRFKAEYTLGIPDNHDIDIYESNYIDSLEKNKIIIPDPDKTGKIW